MLRAAEPLGFFAGIHERRCNGFTVAREVQRRVLLHESQRDPPVLGKDAHEPRLAPDHRLHDVPVRGTDERNTLHSFAFDERTHGFRRYARLAVSASSKVVPVLPPQTVRDGIVGGHDLRGSCPEIPLVFQCAFLDVRQAIVKRAGFTRRFQCIDA